MAYLERLDLTAGQTPYGFSRLSAVRQVSWVRSFLSPILVLLLFARMSEMKDPRRTLARVKCFYANGFVRMAYDEEASAGLFDGLRWITAASRLATSLPTALLKSLESFTCVPW